VQELQARIADIAEKKKYVGQQVPTPYVILARQVDILTKKKSPPIMVLPPNLRFRFRFRSLFPTAFHFRFRFRFLKRVSVDADVE
jgi:hypothetical protein